MLESLLNQAGGISGTTAATLFNSGAITPAQADAILREQAIAMLTGAAGAAGVQDPSSHCLHNAASVIHSLSTNNAAAGDIARI